MFMLYFWQEMSGNNLGQRIWFCVKIDKITSETVDLLRNALWLTCYHVKSIVSSVVQTVQGRTRCE